MYDVRVVEYKNISRVCLYSFLGYSSERLIVSVADRKLTVTSSWTENKKHTVCGDVEYLSLMTAVFCGNFVIQREAAATYSSS